MECLISNAGGGYSRWNDVALTRWRADTTLDNWGCWLYVQDLERDTLWSATRQPLAADPARPDTRKCSSTRTWSASAAVNRILRSHGDQRCARRRR